MDYLSSNSDSGDPEKRASRSPDKAVDPAAAGALPAETPSETSVPLDPVPEGTVPVDASAMPEDAFPVDAVSAQDDQGGTPQGDSGGPSLFGDGNALEVQGLSIPGISDRAYHLAFSQGAPKFVLRKEQMTNERKAGKIRPMSRAECARARSANNFCDPAHPAGCGGTFCGLPAHARMGSDLI